MEFLCNIEIFESTQMVSCKYEVWNFYSVLDCWFLKMVVLFLRRYFSVLELMKIVKLRDKI